MSRLKKLKQVDGKVDRKPTTINQIFGDTGLGKYGTMDRSLYESQLNEMNKSDLQTHATVVGLIPIEDRARLVQRLLREFDRHVASFNAPASKTPAKTPVKMSEAVKKLLSEAR